MKTTPNQKPAILLCSMALALLLPLVAFAGEEAEHGATDTELAPLELFENHDYPSTVGEAPSSEPAAARELVELFGSQGWISVIQLLRCPVDDPFCGGDPDPARCCYEACGGNTFCLEPGESGYYGLATDTPGVCKFVYLSC